MRIWVDAPKAVCLTRGIARENMPEATVRPAWELWQRQEDEYIRTFQPQQKADIIVDGTKSFAEQLGLR